MTVPELRKKIIRSRQVALRAKLWPEIKEEDLWNRKKKSGFTTVPRTMPIFMRILDSMSNGKPLSDVYLDLWCRAFDEHMLALNRKEEMAFACGFTGQRGVQTWTTRIDILAKLGFVLLAEGPNGPRSYILIINPYPVVKRHKTKKTPGITDALYNALLARASEIGADDI